MPEQYVEKYLGIHTADAERVELTYSGDSLCARFVDDQHIPRELLLADTFALRWQEYDDDGAPRTTRPKKCWNPPGWPRSHRRPSFPSAGSCATTSSASTRVARWT